MGGPPLPTFRHITILPSSRQRALSSPPEPAFPPPPHTHTVALALGKTSPHLLWAEGPFRRLLRKSRGVGKRGRGDEQRTEKTGESGEILKKEMTERCEKRKIEGGGRGDEYCIGPLRVMAIVHVVY